MREGVAHLGHTGPEPLSLEWAVEAACRGLDPDFFYSERAALMAQAKEICGRCSVRQQCLDTADRVEGTLSAKKHVHGIWGGETPEERIRRRSLRASMPVS